MDSKAGAANGVLRFGKLFVLGYLRLFLGNVRVAALVVVGAVIFFGIKSLIGPSDPREAVMSEWRDKVAEATRSSQKVRGDTFDESDVKAFAACVTDRMFADFTTADFAAYRSSPELQSRAQDNLTPAVHACGTQGDPGQ